MGSNEKYIELLNLFIDESEDGINWKDKPFRIGNKTAATDGISMVIIPVTMWEFDDKTEKVKAAYPMETSMSKIISIDEIKYALSKVPLLDEYDEVKNKCGACYGSGEVTFEFSHGLEDYEHEGECPICEGDGNIYSKSNTPNGKKVKDYAQSIQLGISIYSIRLIERLIEVMNLLGKDEIKLVHQPEINKGALFLVDDVEMLIMPLLFNFNVSPEPVAIISV